LNSPVCTSAGRLFDAFAVLLDLGTRNSYEGQLPMTVEIAALGATVDGYALPFGINPTTDRANWEIDWRPALTPLLDRPPRDVSKLAAAFHRGLVEAMLKTATLAGVKTVVLSGGCFQNALLRHFAETRLINAGFTVLAPRDLPPGDGAIAAGQALGALRNLTSVTSPVAAVSPVIPKTTTPTLPCASLSPEK
jgi:hydrogenase maturation protein HypF